jgi:hypothetical protein
MAPRLFDDNHMPILPIDAQAVASTVNVFDMLVERFLMALVGVFAGGTYVNWRVGMRITKVEHAIWGTDTNNGMSSRVKQVEEKLGVVVSNQDRHTTLLSNVAEYVGEIRDYIRSQRGTP